MDRKGEKKQDKKLKLLIIAPYCILPAQTGGRIRVYQLSLGLSKQDVEVTVLMPMTPAFYRRKKINENLILEVIPYPFFLPFLLTDKPFPYLYLMSLHPGYAFFCQKFFTLFDVIQFEGVSFGDLVAYLPAQKTVVYDAHNVEYDYAVSEKQGGWAQKISCNRMFALERKLTHRADHILTCDEDDAHRLTELYQLDSTKLITIANGIHLRREDIAPSPSSVSERFSTLSDFPRRAIFSGSDVAHNRAAVQYLVESLAPALRDEVAFIIKGACGKRFEQYEGGNLFFDLSPGDLRPYLNPNTVAINPITQGSGTSLKVLDFLAQGLPLISTDFGMRGYDNLKAHVVISPLEGFEKALRMDQKTRPGLETLLKSYAWDMISKTHYETLFPQADQSVQSLCRSN